MGTRALTTGPSPTSPKDKTWPGTLAVVSVAFLLGLLAGRASHPAEQGALPSPELRPSPVTPAPTPPPEAPPQTAPAPTPADPPANATEPDEPPPPVQRRWRAPDDLRELLAECRKSGQILCSPTQNYLEEELAARLTRSPSLARTFLDALRGEEEEEMIDTLWRALAYGWDDATDNGQSPGPEWPSTLSLIRREMLDILTSDSNPLRRDAAVSTLGWFRAEEALPALRHAAEFDPDPSVRSSALGQLTRFPGESCTRLIAERALADPHEGVRKSAVRSLEWIPGLGAFETEAMVKLFQSDPNGATGNAAIRTVLGQDAVESRTRAMTAIEGELLHPSGRIEPAQLVALAMQVPRREALEFLHRHENDPSIGGLVHDHLAAFDRGEVPEPWIRHFKRRLEAARGVLEEHR
ncbi:MAG: HEAT repeat domain-containing protein [Planctomycetes bacterium]|nr:HEAT repeat domain-containing protein [Planctomycetota bacterium]